MKWIEKLKEQKYTIAFSENKMFEKIKTFGKKAGIQVIYLVLLLFYTLQKSTTPKFAKSLIVGGLGYFILPTDFLPDLIPVIGFTDDLTALISVVIAVALFVDDAVKAKAKERLRLWFGDYDVSELKGIDEKIDHEAQYKRT